MGSKRPLRSIIQVALSLGLALSLTACSSVQKVIKSPPTTRLTTARVQPVTPEDPMNNAYFMPLEVGTLVTTEDVTDFYLYKENLIEIGDPAIDDLIRQEVSSFYKEFQKTKTVANTIPEDKSILLIDCATYRIDSQRFTYVIRAYQLNAGDAHGNTEHKTLYFDRESGNRLSLDEILSDSYLNVLSELSDTYFRESPTYQSMVDSELYRDGITPSTDNYREVVVHEQGVNVIFPRYQLFSGNFGSPTVSLSLNDRLQLRTKEKQVREPVIETETEAPTPTPQATAATEAPPQTPTKLIALTFDDGPYSPVDQAIMDAAAAVGGHVTFFWLGSRLNAYQDTVKQAQAAGHEIGNHSTRHFPLTKLAQPGVAAELTGMDTLLEQITGIKPAFVRPTYGAFNDIVKATAARPLVNWSVDTEDWRSQDEEAIYQAIMKGAEDGAIVLMHDIYLATAAAVTRAIPDLAAQGYEFVTVSELLARRGRTPAPGEIVWSVLP